MPTSVETGVECRVAEEELSLHTEQQLVGTGALAAPRANEVEASSSSRAAR